MTITLPYKWRIRAKQCDGSGKDAFNWAADELEEALQENREKADECQRILNSDKCEQDQMREIRAVFASNDQG